MHLKLLLILLTNFELPEAILVIDPKKKLRVVRAPCLISCPQEMRPKIMHPKTKTKIAQMEYSALKKASAPREIAL